MTDNVCRRREKRDPANAIGTGRLYRDDKLQRRATWITTEACSLFPSLPLCLILRIPFGTRSIRVKVFEGLKTAGPRKSLASRDNSCARRLSSSRSRNGPILARGSQLFSSQSHSLPSLTIIPHLPAYVSRKHSGRYVDHRRSFRSLGIQRRRTACLKYEKAKNTRPPLWRFPRQCTVDGKYLHGGSMSTRKERRLCGSYL